MVEYLVCIEDWLRNTHLELHVEEKLEELEEIEKLGNSISFVLSMFVLFI